ncbi:MAG: hypothetical protein ACE5Z5_10345 [Candidatus Bathyarchaeia archaeon]
MEGGILEYKGVIGSQRRMTIPRIYVLTYGVWEGSVVSVRLYNRENFRDSEFLAQVQRGFRFQIPRVEYQHLGLRRGSVLDIRIEKVEGGKVAAS